MRRQYRTRQRSELVELVTTRQATVQSTAGLLVLAGRHHQDGPEEILQALDNFARNDPLIALLVLACSRVTSAAAALAKTSFAACFGGVT
jgi:hypothetical protein